MDINSDVVGMNWTPVLLYSRNCESTAWAGDFSRSRVAGLTRTLEGTFWSCWDTYSGRHEMICARSFDGQQPGELETVCCDSSCWSPDIAAGSDGQLVCTWSSRKDSGWGVYASCRKHNQWSAPVEISQSQGDHLNSKIGFGSDGLAGLVWVRYLQGRTDIMVRFYRDGQWSDEYTVSETGETNLRPDIALNGNGDAYIVWDCYHDGRYDICARSVSQDGFSKVWYVTDSPEQDFKPTVTLDGQGMPVVAWVHMTYVTAADLVENLSKINVAGFDGVNWQLLTDSDNKDYAVHLGHGVLWENPSLGRKHSGYVGFRRKPMLTTDGQGQVWLLWERNEDPTIPYDVSSGLLCGRRWEQTRWSKEIILHKGHLAYTAGRFLPGRQEDFCLLTRGEGGADFLKDLKLLKGNFPEPSQCAPFEIDESMWSQWQPKSLSSRKVTQRVKIQIDNEEYRLFWIDLHCHSCLTGGEAGEPDELYHFARDKGHLDAFAVSDSDTYFGEIMPLNPSAWFATQRNAATFYRPGDFVTFSGYEWDKNIDYNTGKTVVDSEVAKQVGGMHNHHNVYFLTDDQPIFRCDETIAEDNKTFEKCLNGVNGFSSCHHEK